MRGWIFYKKRTGRNSNTRGVAWVIRETAFRADDRLHEGTLVHRQPGGVVKRAHALASCCLRPIQFSWMLPAGSLQRFQRNHHVWQKFDTAPKHENTSHPTSFACCVVEKRVRFCRAATQQDRFRKPKGQISSSSQSARHMNSSLVSPALYGHICFFYLI